MTTKTLIEVDVPEGANILHVAMDFYGDLHQVGFRLVPPARAVPEGLISRIKEMHADFERFGASCEFEGCPMVPASLLDELMDLINTAPSPTSSGGAQG